MLVASGDAIWDYGGALVCYGTEGHLWFYVPAVAGVQYHQRTGGHPWAALPPPGVMLLCEGCAELAPPLSRPSRGAHPRAGGEGGLILPLATCST